ncbi:RING finger protein 141-like [Impatiens glandulifera]|uniref:RING finger protein 141-like n=1 Tax=Impatiens glandulifera TaxID=253017 RepID=UPI001FB08C89|nr:RING finger protein 141-like [Impatiens glandulifera]
MAPFWHMEERFDYGISNEYEQIDPSYDVMELDFGVIRKDKVEIPSDDRVYFYIKMEACFTYGCISGMEDFENFLGDLVDESETTGSFMIPRDKLLSEDPLVRKDTISDMIIEMGVRPTWNMMDPILEVAHTMATRQLRTVRKKILPFSVYIYVEDYVDTHDYSADEDEEDLILEEEAEEEAMAMQPEFNMEIFPVSELVGGEKCIICLDELPSKDEKDLKRTGCCRHVFHGECIDKWLVRRSLCPLCRFQI